jgi:hypothetical protein
MHNNTHNRTTPRIAIDRRVPIAFLAAMLLQAAVAVWWTADQAALLRYHEQRLNVMDARSGTDARQQNEMLVRLARIEERIAAQTALLADIRNQFRK